LVAACHGCSWLVQMYHHNLVCGSAGFGACWCAASCAQLARVALLGATDYSWCFWPYAAARAVQCGLSLGGHWVAEPPAPQSADHAADPWAQACHAWLPVQEGDGDYLSRCAQLAVHLTLAQHRWRWRRWLSRRSLQHLACNLCTLKCLPQKVLRHLLQGCLPGAGPHALTWHDQTLAFGEWSVAHTVVSYGFWLECRFRQSCMPSAGRSSPAT
jgi:hypothetical protein